MATIENTGTLSLNNDNFEIIGNVLHSKLSTIISDEQVTVTATGTVTEVKTTAAFTLTIDYTEIESLALENVKTYIPARRGEPWRCRRV